jgi:small GTP-binding protein
MMDSVATSVLPIDANDPDFLVKLILVGDSGVGKTNLLGQFLRNKFNPASKTTIGVQFATKTLTIRDKVVKAQIWDTAGQERYRAITSSYYKGTHGAMIVYDITSWVSFKSVGKWLTELRENSGPSIIVMLIGNKTDCEDARSVPTQDGENLAQREGLLFIETSAKSATNVREAFDQLTADVLTLYEKIGFEQIRKPKDPLLRSSGIVVQQEDKGCC